MGGERLARQQNIPERLTAVVPPSASRTRTPSVPTTGSSTPDEESQDRQPYWGQSPTRLSRSDGAGGPHRVRPPARNWLRSKLAQPPGPLDQRPPSFRPGLTPALDFEGVVRRWEGRALVSMDSDGTEVA